MKWFRNIVDWMVKKNDFQDVINVFTSREIKKNNCLYSDFFEVIIIVVSLKFNFENVPWSAITNIHFV
jgi:hypothetical protein